MGHVIFNAVPDLLVAAVFCVGAAGHEVVGAMGRGGGDAETRNFNRGANSVGCFAVAAFMMNTAANDLGGYGDLGRFVMHLPDHHQAFQIWLTLGVWALLLSTSVLGFCVAMSAPAGRRSARWIRDVASDPRAGCRIVVLGWFHSTL